MSPLGLQSNFQELGPLYFPLQAITTLLLPPTTISFFIDELLVGPSTVGPSIQTVS